MKTQTGLAQPDIQGLVDEINRFQTTLDHTELDLKRTRKRAENIKDNVSIDYGFAILGMIACFEGDVESMKSYSERAVQQSGGLPEHLYNYSLSLKLFNLHEEAYEKADAAYRKNPADLRYLNNLIQLVCILNKRDEFDRYVKLYKKATQKRHPLEKAALNAIEDNWEFATFIADNPDLDVRDNPPEFVDKCFEKIPEIFGTPIAVVFSVMPDEEWKPSLVGWI